MTREILFRGKRVDNGEWIEGYLIRPLFNKTRSYIGYLFPDGDHDIDVAEVDLSTVGQFTGLTDRNDVRIFEGDIIKWHVHTELSVSGQIAEVCYGKYREADSVFVFDDSYSLGFYIRFPGNVCTTICSLDEYKNDFDIIGNIYDNPDLLEASSNE